MGLFGLFGKKDAGADGADAGKPSPYAHLGPQVVAEVNKFASIVGKEWQTLVTHRNFDRSPFETQLKLFLEKMDRELNAGKFPLVAALAQRGQVKINGVYFEAMAKAVVVIGAAKLLAGFEKLGRAPD